MKKQGNGTPENCTNNLLRMIRGENPMERLKGLGTEFIDGEKDTSFRKLKDDASWLLKTYEPRVSINNFEITNSVDFSGNYNIKAIFEEV